VLFSKHFNLQSVGRLAGVKREIKTETTGSFAYNFLVLKKVPDEPNFSVNRTALQQSKIIKKFLPGLKDTQRRAFREILANRVEISVRRLRETAE
jgi:hypothetical protein